MHLIFCLGFLSSRYYLGEKLKDKDRFVTHVIVEAEAKCGIRILSCVKYFIAKLRIWSLHVQISLKITNTSTFSMSRPIKLSSNGVEYDI